MDNHISSAKQDPKVLTDVEGVIERSVRNVIDQSGFGAFVDANLIHGLVVQISSDVIKAGYRVVKA